MASTPAPVGNFYEKMCAKPIRRTSSRCGYEYDAGTVRTDMPPHEPCRPLYANFCEIVESYMIRSMTLRIIIFKSKQNKLCFVVHAKAGFCRGILAAYFPVGNRRKVPIISHFMRVLCSSNYSVLNRVLAQYVLHHRIDIAHCECRTHPILL